MMKQVSLVVVLSMVVPLAHGFDFSLPEWMKISSENEQQAATVADAVDINGSVYLSEVQKALKSNAALNEMEKNRKAREDALTSLQKKVLEISQQGENHKNAAARLTKEHLANEGKLLRTIKEFNNLTAEERQIVADAEKAHKDLGAQTSSDGDARILPHIGATIQKAFNMAGNYIEKFPTEVKVKSLSEKVHEIQKQITEENKKEAEAIAETTKSVAELSRLAQFDAKTALNNEEALKRKVALGALLNSVNNLITQEKSTKNLSEMAFNHFDEIGKELATKGLTAKDVKDAYNEKKGDLAGQFNETPIGVYVNGQISKAMSSVCDLMTNQCQAGSIESVFNFLNDSKRSIYKETKKDSDEAWKVKSEHGTEKK